MKRLLENSRYIVLIGVFGTFLASLSLFLFGIGSVISAIFKALITSNQFEAGRIKELSVVLIQTIDIFLLATVFYIIALGLYELFIDSSLQLPHWLEIKTLDDLEIRLLSVVVVILPVTFLGKLVEWKSGIDILWLGLAVGSVLLSVAFIQYVVTKKHPGN